MGLFRQSDGELRNEESHESSDSPFQFLSNFWSALTLAEHTVILEYFNIKE